MVDNTTLADELEDKLQYLIDHLSEAQGSRDADCGYVTGKQFQMMTMCPDPEGLADAINALPTILAALRTPAPAPAQGDVVEALRQARDDLLAVGNDYPGSSCQKWCTERAKAAWDTLRPWEHCPSTHCERTQECRSVNECSANKSTVAALQAQPAPAQQFAESANYPTAQGDVVERVAKAIYEADADSSGVEMPWSEASLNTQVLDVYATSARAALAAMQQAPRCVSQNQPDDTQAGLCEVGETQPQADAAVAVERDAVMNAAAESIRLIDEVNEFRAARDANGISTALHGKLCKARGVLVVALAAIRAGGQA